MSVKEEVLEGGEDAVGIEVRVATFSLTNMIITTSPSSIFSPPPPPPPILRNLMEIQSNMEELKIMNVSIENLRCKENLLFSNISFAASSFLISNLQLQNVNTALHLFQLTSTLNIEMMNISLLNSSSSSAFSLMFNNLSSLVYLPFLPLPSLPFIIIIIIRISSSLHTSLTINL